MNKKRDAALHGGISEQEAQESREDANFLLICVEIMFVMMILAIMFTVGDLMGSLEASK